MDLLTRMNQAMQRLARSRSALSESVKAYLTNWPIRRRAASPSRHVEPRDISAHEPPSPALQPRSPARQGAGRSSGELPLPFRVGLEPPSPARQGAGQGRLESHGPSLAYTSPGGACRECSSPPSPRRPVRSRRAARSTGPWLWTALGLLIGAAVRLLWIWGNT
jgi:hypothetical protein